MRARPGILQQSYAADAATPSGHMAPLIGSPSESWLPPFSFLAWRASHAPFCTALTTRRVGDLGEASARARIELAFNAAFAAILGTVSATIASVVIKSPAIDDASCRAQRTTLGGSITPWRQCGQSDVGRSSKNLSVHRASPTTASRLPRKSKSKTSSRTWARKCCALLQASNQQHSSCAIVGVRRGQVQQSPGRILENGRTTDKDAHPAVDTREPRIAIRTVSGGASLYVLAPEAEGVRREEQRIDCGNGKFRCKEALQWQPRERERRWPISLMRRNLCCG
jgi:hypothetical protein